MVHRTRRSPTHLTPGRGAPLLHRRNRRYCSAKDAFAALRHKQLVFTVGPPAGRIHGHTPAPAVKEAFTPGSAAHSSFTSTHSQHCRSTDHADARELVR